MAFELGPSCKISSAETHWTTYPEPVITFIRPSANLHSADYKAPIAGTYGDTMVVNINATYYTLLNATYASVGGYPNCRLRFLTYKLKPQLSTPGGNILATWPLGRNSGYRAIFSETELSPGEITFGDDENHQNWGRANITIKNRSSRSKTYSLSHIGAGYTNLVRLPGEGQQLANYGTVDFEASEVTLASGESSTIQFTVKPPSNVVERQLPVFGGFIQATRPYSVYNAEYIDTQNLGRPSLPQRLEPGGRRVVVVNNGTFEYAESGPPYPTISAATLQCSRSPRVDFLPAATSIVPSRYGFDQSGLRNQTYIPSSRVTPNSTIFGFPSFGSSTNQTGVLYPFSIETLWMWTSVRSDNDVLFANGPGDYRFLSSVLRWVGVEGDQEACDTWLGPVVRIVA
ncbi:hypothetical protein LZ554_009100 [Drepanopeziza brunnea f. sp. 'monogermtubi']|nr:hypothetical protein LZ554_009100 [Drepanopeziza brunnea f. sp. 'monogermtubi']